MANQQKKTASSLNNYQLTCRCFMHRSGVLTDGFCLGNINDIHGYLICWGHLWDFVTMMMRFFTIHYELMQWSLNQKYLLTTIIIVARIQITMTYCYHYHYHHHHFSSWPMATILIPISNLIVMIMIAAHCASSGLEGSTIGRLLARTSPGRHGFWVRWHPLYILNQFISHIIWHSIWHIFWHPIWHSFWRSIWLAVYLT